MRRIYFDYAASAPLRPAARTAMLEALVGGNASSIHAEGQAARFRLDQARRTVAECLNVRAERVVFTSGGTEANNLALRGVRAAVPGTILYSALEHDCVRNTARALGDAAEIPATEDGVVRLEWLAERLAHGGVTLVSVMHANNENGVLQPIAEIAALCKRFGAILHVDAVQTVGHLPVEVDALGADLLSFSGHKFGGPLGAGGLVIKPELNMLAHTTGGAQERKRRAGTENVPALAGMAAALAAAVHNMPQELAMATTLAAEFEALAATLSVQLVGARAEKVAHVRQVVCAGRKGEELVIACDMAGVAVSQGSACSSGRVQSSHVLQALGYNEADAGAGLRVSWGWDSSLDEMRALGGVLGTVLGR